MLIFEGGGVVEVIEVVVWGKINHPRKRARMLVFKGDGGGEVGDLPCHCRLRWQLQSQLSHCPWCQVSK